MITSSTTSPLLRRGLYLEYTTLGWNVVGRQINRIRFRGCKHRPVSAKRIARGELHLQPRLTLSIGQRGRRNRIAITS